MFWYLLKLGRDKAATSLVPYLTKSSVPFVSADNGHHIVSGRKQLKLKVEKLIITNYNQGEPPVLLVSGIILSDLKKNFNLCYYKWKMQW